MSQTWSCLVKALKPVPVVVEYKPLCFLEHPEIQPKQHTAEINTHGEDFLRLPTCSHVGVVDLFEDHPGFVMLPHLTGGRVSGKRRRQMNLWDQHQHSLLRDSNSLTSKIIYSLHICIPLITPRLVEVMRVRATMIHFTSNVDHPAAVNL